MQSGAYEREDVVVEQEGEGRVPVFIRAVGDRVGGQEHRHYLAVGLAVVLL
jgi:hypothetical protein